MISISPAIFTDPQQPSILKELITIKKNGELFIRPDITKIVKEKLQVWEPNHIQQVIPLLHLYEQQVTYQKNHWLTSLFYLFLFWKENIYDAKLESLKECLALAQESIKTKSLFSLPSKPPAFSPKIEVNNSPSKRPQKKRINENRFSPKTTSPSSPPLKERTSSPQIDFNNSPSRRPSKSSTNEDSFFPKYGTLQSPSPLREQKKTFSPSGSSPSKKTAARPSSISTSSSSSSLHTVTMAPPPPPPPPLPIHQVELPSSQRYLLKGEKKVPQGITRKIGKSPTDKQMREEIEEIEQFLQSLDSVLDQLIQHINTCKKWEESKKALEAEIRIEENKLKQQRNKLVILENPGNQPCVFLNTVFKGFQEEKVPYFTDEMFEKIKSQVYIPYLSKIFLISTAKKKITKIAAHLSASIDSKRQEISDLDGLIARSKENQISIDWKNWEAAIKEKETLKKEWTFALLSRKKFLDPVVNPPKEKEKKEIPIVCSEEQTDTFPGMREFLSLSTMTMIEVRGAVSHKTYDNFYNRQVAPEDKNFF